MTQISAQVFAQKSRDIKFEEVKEIGIKSYLNIKEPVQSTRMASGLQVQIEPIDASTLNEMYYENSKYSGKYNYTFFTTNVQDHFLTLKKRKRRYLKSENEFLYEGLYYLLDNDEIDQDIYDKLVYEVALGSEEEEEQKIADLYTSDNKQNFNPFYIGGRYLNVFKVTVKNPTSSAMKNDLNFQVYNGGESLQFLGDGSVANWGFSGGIKSQNLVRSNINNYELFPSNSTTISYFATLPLNLNTEEIKIAISDGNSTSEISWNADVKRSSIDNIKLFYEIQLKPTHSSLRAYYVVESENADIYVVGNYLYINEADIDKDIEIYYYGMLTKRLFRGVSDVIKIGDYMDFEKSKRSKVKIQSKILSEVKRTAKPD